MWIIFFVITIFIVYWLLDKGTNKSNPNRTHNTNNTKSNEQILEIAPPDRRIFHGTPKLPPSSNEFLPTHISSFIAGIPHRLGKNIQISSILSKGQNLQYAREPGNRYDKNAIKLIANGTHIGYVPRDDNPKIASHLDSGKQIVVNVTSLDVSDLWRGIRINIILN